MDCSRNGNEYVKQAHKPPAFALFVHIAPFTPVNVLGVGAESLSSCLVVHQVHMRKALSQPKKSKARKIYERP